MKTDKQFAELAWDPSINATQIGVEVPGVLKNAIGDIDADSRKSLHGWTDQYVAWLTRHES